MREHRKTMRLGDDEIAKILLIQEALNTKGVSATIRQIINDWQEQ